MANTATPTPKVAVAGVAGAVVLIIVWVVGMFGVDVPAEVAAAATVIVSFLGGYLKRDATSPGNATAARQINLD